MMKALLWSPRRAATASAICLIALALGPGPLPEQDPASKFPNYCVPTITPVIPGDVVPILEQYPANCFSWQSFIALNWPAQPGQSGQPNTAKKFGQGGPVVWGTFKNIDDVFLPEAQEPTPWGGPTVPKILAMTSKAHPGVPLFPSIQQAAPALSSWLVAQNRTLVRYEVLINQTEFDYIFSNKFYNAAYQAGAVGLGAKGIIQPVESIEVKAAWVEMTTGLDSRRYFTTEAILPSDPSSVPAGQSRRALMGLVGLHIIHKTPNAPQYIWSTFEHVDNCPDVGTADPSKSYTFYNPTFQKDAYNLTPRQNPTQVQRVAPLPDMVKQINVDAQAAIREYNRKNNIPDSPWEYYQLVNTQWPSDAQVIPPGSQAPLPNGNMIPRILLNTTLETYIQGAEGIPQSCMGCHMNATIANMPGDRPRFASDYSFVYGKAKFPPAPPAGP